MMKIKLSKLSIQNNNVFISECSHLHRIVIVEKSQQLLLLQF